jgi:hypothetical protein
MEGLFTLRQMEGRQLETGQMDTDMADVAFVFLKMHNTIHRLSERFPEMLFIASGMKQAKYLSGEQEDSLAVLVRLNEYLQDQLFEYYVVRSLHASFQQDIACLQQGRDINRVHAFYLEYI